MSFFEYIVWVPLTFYFFSICAQNWYLWREKTAHALSTYSVIAMGIGLSCFSWHAVLCDLPLAYKVMFFPQSLLALLTLYFIYRFAHTPARKQFAWNSMIGVCLVFGAISTSAWFFPQATGRYTGWAQVAILFFVQAPQIVRLWASKTGAGISLSRLGWLVAASSLQMLTTLYISVSVPALLTFLRSWILNLILLGQYYYYRNDRHREYADKSPFYRKIRGWIQ